MDVELGRCSYALSTPTGARNSGAARRGARTLIDIEAWDFRWQHVYRFERPVSLPKGTRVAMEYRYDNSSENPRNPQLPPARVFWGQRSVDEMGDQWFQFVTHTNADRERLNEQILSKMTREDITGYETMLRANPRDAELHDDVALLYLSLGQANEAVRHFAASKDIKPAAASAHFNLARRCRCRPFERRGRGIPRSTAAAA